MTRAILHVDMDAFYASVEERDDPSLRGKPVVVGGDPHGRGVVAAASYEARRHGIRSAMPAAAALRLCPHAVFLRPRFDRYREVSDEIFEILQTYAPLVEPLSLDEAYLDVTDSPRRKSTVRALAREIQRDIRRATGLTASIGGGPNKLVAKIASDYRKPNGLVVVPPKRVREFLDPLPVERIWGIGPKSADKLAALGVRTIRDLAEHTPEFLARAFGKAGRLWHRLARGEDERPVDPGGEAKSVGSETTYPRDLVSLGEVRKALAPLAEKVFARLARYDLKPLTVTLKVKYADFQQVSRAATLPAPPEGADEIRRVAEALLRRTEAPRRPVRLLGITTSHFLGSGPVQLYLFDITLGLVGKTTAEGVGATEGTG